MKFPVILLLFGVLISCAEQTSDNVESGDVETQKSPPDLSKVGLRTYAVVWSWENEDPDLIQENLPSISMELNNLWMEERVENVYFDTDESSELVEPLPNISFFLRANDEQEARNILDELTVVKKELSSYELHPVGKFWLGRKPNLKRTGMKSFVSVWTTERSLDEIKGADKILQAQNDSILALWKRGILENAYLDIEGTYSPNEDQDFVVFVNAISMDEAQKICDELPFSKEAIAGFELYEAGVFWLGLYSEE